MSAAPQQRRLLHRRWVYHTLREVWMVDESVVEKRFQHFPGRRDWRPLWQREHRALQHLTGLPVPRSLGWHRESSAQGPVHVLQKTFVPGEPLRTTTVRDATDMGALLAAFHQRLVVNNDPSPTNFVRTPEGHLACIDFGRSRTFRWRSSYFYFYVGKELARLYRTGLMNCPALWEAFLASYQQHSTLLQHHQKMIRWSFLFWRWRARHRHHELEALKAA